MTAPTPRHWFRLAFSLRTLFVVVTVAAILSPFARPSANFVYRTFLETKEEREFRELVELIKTIKPSVWGDPVD